MSLALQPKSAIQRLHWASACCLHWPMGCQRAIRQQAVMGRPDKLTPQWLSSAIAGALKVGVKAGRGQNRVGGSGTWAGQRREGSGSGI